MSGQSLTGFDPRASVRFWLADRFIFTSGPFDREEISTYTFQVKVSVVHSVDARSVGVGV